MGEVLKRHPHLQFLGDFAALIAKLSLPVGGIYLFHYCTEFGIPFPTSLSELPALLVAIAAAGLFVTWIAAGFVFMPALLSDMLEPGYSLLYERKASRTSTLSLMLLTPLFALMYGLLAMTMVSISVHRWVIGLCAAASIVLSLGIGLHRRLTGFSRSKRAIRRLSAGDQWAKARATSRLFVRIRVWWRVAKSREAARAIIAAGAQIFCCFAWVFGILFILLESKAASWVMEWFPAKWSFRNFMGLAVLVGAPVLIVWGLAWLGIQDRYRPSSGNRAIPLLPAIMIFATAVTFIHPMFASGVAQMALVPLGLGGGQGICYTADAKMPVNAREQLGFDRYGNAGPIRVALDVGPRLFVLPTEPQSNEKAVAYPSEWFLYRRRPSRQPNDGQNLLEVTSVCVPIGTSLVELALQ